MRWGSATVKCSRVPLNNRKENAVMAKRKILIQTVETIWSSAEVDLPDEAFETDLHEWIQLHPNECMKTTLHIQNVINSTTNAFYLALEDVQAIIYSEDCRTLGRIEDQIMEDSRDLTIDLMEKLELIPTTIVTFIEDVDEDLFAKWNTKAVDALNFHLGRHQIPPIVRAFVREKGVL
jgi:hypothetical protein